MGFADFGPPDCQDHQADVNKILLAAGSSKTQDDFLNKIGPNSLRVMTFNVESLNEGFAGCISKKKPGPVRSSLDGGIILRYCCDRSSPSYGLVELIVQKNSPPGFETYNFKFQGDLPPPS